ncbi:hypothetical protein PVAND_016708 [Polypedilum vanderplanki]|uniref:Sulfotransferase domain-containing protein n=1 Tax=Polypedilum vanderplanki TaxID=319348 RepID=A0A9J6BH49_POLVA|nr:hypothetical protein PVAND_016708 [Polypedilum vanderplanki]
MFEIVEINDKIIRKVMTSAISDYVDIIDKNNSKNHCVLIKKYAHTCAENIKNFKVYDDDIWVVTFPKSGTTWTQEMVWLINNNLDYEKALNTDLQTRFPFIELEGIIELPGFHTIKNCEKLQRPRHIKSHLPPFLLPNQLWTIKPKIIYTCRNPKDVAVSYYHHYRHLQGYTGTREDFFNAFLEDKVLHSPMNENVLEFWKLSKENKNVLFLFYEDMKRNLELEIRKVARFLRKKYNQDQIDKLFEHLSFESMKKNPMCNFEENVNFIKKIYKHVTINENFQFIREGEIGSYKKEMNEEEIRKFDEYMDYFEFKEHGFEYKS